MYCEEGAGAGLGAGDGLGAGRGVGAGAGEGDTLLPPPLLPQAAKPNKAAKTALIFMVDFVMTIPFQKRFINNKQIVLKEPADYNIYLQINNYLEQILD